jgi:hypothetical protein
MFRYVFAWQSVRDARPSLLALALELGQPVLDQTNIEGNYDVGLNFDDDGANSAVLGSMLAALR